MSPAPATLYDVLGVAADASVTDIRDAFVAAARQHHPDAGGDAARMRALNEAWAVLGDAVRRHDYDRSLRPAATAAPAPFRDPTPVVRTDAEDLAADLEDDRAIGGVVRLPGWLSLIPPGTFGLSILLGFGGLLFLNRALLAAGFVAFLASCVFFLVSPFVALLASRSGMTTGSSIADEDR